MQGSLTATALSVLLCAACATVNQGSRDARLVEAQRAFEEGQRLRGAGQYAQAIPLIERALELREAVLGNAHPEVATCLDLLGGLHLEGGENMRAAPLLQRALVIREVALGRRHPDVARSLDNLANLYRAQGSYARAEPLYERALAIQEEVLGKQHPDVASSLHDLAHLYMDQGHSARAEPLLERALAIREAALGKRHPEVARTLSSLGALYWSQGNYARAEPLFERALAIREESLGQHHPEVGSSLQNLATLYMNQGDYARAEPLFERALAIWEAALGKHHPDVAQLLNGLANLYRTQGNYARAEPLYERALAIREAALGKNHPEVAQALNNLASLYKDQGLYARAEPVYERALTIRETALGKNHPDVAFVLNGLANLYYAQGSYERAEPLYERALTIREEALGKHHPNVAQSLNNLALLYMDQGNYARAEPLFERALAIREATLGEHHADVASTLHNLALLYMAQGHYARAEPLFERALAIWEETLGKHHPDVASSLNSLAQLRFAQQRLDEALPLFERAFAVSEEHLRQEVYGFSETHLASVLRKLRDDEERLYGLVRSYPGDAAVRRLALTAALLRKGRSVEEVSNTSRIIYRGLGQEERATFECLRALRTQLSTLSLNGPGKLSAATYQQRLKELAEQGDALEADLARRSAPLRALRALPSPSEIIDRVAATLPKDGALVEFVAYNDASLVPKLSAAASQTPGQLHYLALLLFADGRTHAVDIGPAAPIDAAALRLHDALADDTASYTPAAQALYKLAFRPLVPLLGKVQRLFLSPDGQLSLVPFAALHDGRRFLVDAFDMTYLTSGKELLPRPAEVTPARSVVVLADPDFGSPPAAPALTAQSARVPAERSASLERFFSSVRADLEDGHFPPLPGTRKEAEAIRQLFPEARLLLGSAATKDALLKLPTPDVLHIATHGFFLEDAAIPDGSRAVGSFGALVEAGPLQRPPDPLLRSGLVLASAHAPEAQPGSQHLEDSLVTALELAGMDLWGTQLVVLSACDTGRGDVRLGQGVYGLRRALVVAGAETLVTSLWKVNDETTQELMTDYYRNLLGGQGRTSALRQAMLVLRQKRPHPHFWAPFIAIGQDAPLQGLAPRTPRGRGNSSSRLHAWEAPSRWAMQKSSRSP